MWLPFWKFSSLFFSEHRIFHMMFTNATIPELFTIVQKLVLITVWTWRKANRNVWQKNLKLLWLHTLSSDLPLHKTTDLQKKECILFDIFLSIWGILSPYHAIFSSKLIFENTIFHYDLFCNCSKRERNCNSVYPSLGKTFLSCALVFHVNRTNFSFIESKALVSAALYNDW